MQARQVSPGADKAESMDNYKCEICGGDLVLTIGAETAVCDHCGRSTAIDPADAKKYQRIYQSAERMTHTGSVSGYREAVKQMETIAFIPQAKEQIELYEKQIEALQRKKEQQAHTRAADEKSGTAVGVIVVIVVVLFLLAAVGLIGFEIYRLIKGEMTRTEMIVTIAVAAAAAVLLIVGKARSK